MTSAKVKICGIRTSEAAKAAAQAGADFLGFNFVPTSKRKVSIEDARLIIASIPQNSKPSVVGIFKDETLDEIRRIRDAVPLQYIQLHGNEDPKFSEALGGNIIKVFSLAEDFDILETKQKMKSHKASFYLLDRAIQGKGRMLDLSKVSILAKEFPIMLSGGLDPHNVSGAVQKTHPFGVDVAGGIEIDYAQDEEKIVSFIRNAKSA